jgi:hypothetical protein
MKKYLPKIKVYICLTIIVASSFMPLKAFATDTEFYSSNDILFYDENSSSGCYNSGTSESYSTSSIENQKIAAQFLTSTNFSGNGDKPLNAVQMAAIMGNIQQESGFNPEATNGSFKGIVQWDSGRWGKISEPKTNLDNQLDFIKTELDGGYKKSLGNFWDISDFSDIDEATYLIVRNYEVAIIGNGGSTNWTNDSDATTNVQDWVKRRDYARNMYNTYGNLAGSNTACIGMDISQAESFMETYENSDGNNLYQKYSCSGYGQQETDSTSKNILANCVAVVVYFIQNYTTLDHIALPNGGQVVSTLIQHGFTDGGHTPQPYAVFSTNRYSSSSGHTGIVLGISGDSVIVFEEGCGGKLHKDGNAWAGIKTYPMSEATTLYTYAYPPEGSLKGLR